MTSASLLGMISVCLQLLASAESGKSCVSLVQGAVHVHDLKSNSEDQSGPTGKFLVDNRRLKHKGPGLLWRLSKDVNDTVGKDRYAAWGVVVDGRDSGDGWIQVGNLYLPTRIHGVPVVIPHYFSTNSQRLRIRYEPTELKTQDGSWVPCDITGTGSKPGLYDVHVHPATFASYEMTDVPANQLKEVEHVRVFMPAPAPRPESESDVLNLQVADFAGNTMNLRILRKSPLRTVMKVACEQVQISWEECQQSVRFTHRGVQVSEADHSWEVGLKDGESLRMQRA
eukprot:CAMPEP_0179052878 /NCGR_PEP_ID=MMETSP0796-20121207/21981_1 /TAXON_ID=73915 /ORGANISM="Pyrodinium bahamense, Strain pbaha01" /LENGTH=282 /DNA_ID=CAMNT_0020749451 /DNA_START=67 /DNA_END=915 /DNA_ORIENTATION=-